MYYVLLFLWMYVFRLLLISDLIYLHKERDYNGEIMFLWLGQTASLFGVSIASTPCTTLCYLKRLSCSCMTAWLMMLNLIVIQFQNFSCFVCIWSVFFFPWKNLGLLSALLPWGLLPTSGDSMVQSWGGRWLMAWCYAAESVAWNFTENRYLVLSSWLTWHHVCRLTWHHLRLNCHTNHTIGKRNQF